jgi:hypothetical protein
LERTFKKKAMRTNTRQNRGSQTQGEGSYGRYSANQNQYGRRNSQNRESTGNYDRFDEDDYWSNSNSGYNDDYDRDEQSSYRNDYRNRDEEQRGYAENEVEGGYDNYNDNYTGRRNSRGEQSDRNVRSSNYYPENYAGNYGSVGRNYRSSEGRSNEDSMNDRDFESGSNWDRNSNYNSDYDRNYSSSRPYNERSEYDNNYSRQQGRGKGYSESSNYYGNDSNNFGTNKRSNRDEYGY